MKLIVAVDSKNGIAKNGRIPWRDKSDLGFFKTITYGSTIVMGRKTYYEIGSLPGRKTIVITSKDSNSDNFINIGLYRSFIHDTSNHFVIGGEKTYNSLVDLVDTVFLTRINGDWGCDQFFYLPEEFKKVSGFRLDTGSLVERYEQGVRK